MAKAQQWSTISLKPLIGPLDTRSRPADIPPGAFRTKLNFAVTPEGKMRRRGGFNRAWSDVLYDDNGLPLTDPNAGEGIHYHNHDHHHVEGTRHPITLMYECTWGDKTRQFFDAAQDRISVLNEGTGYWTDIATGKGTYGSYWTCAFLQDTVIFTNDVDNVLAYPKGGPAAEIPSLRDTMQVTKAKIAIEFNGVIMLMNIEQDGVRQASRVIWCDLNLPLDWDQAKDGTIAGQQDLDYGDEILGAALMLGSVYIYTRRKIWRVFVGGITQDDVFSFQTVYSEPKNQTGCLSFPRTLVSTGGAHFYVSRDGIYKFSPYVAEPQREEWLHRASGVMFTKTDTAMTGVQCAAPVSEYRPLTREVWFSWPSGSNTVNNYTLVAQLDHQTADLVDAGFTSFCNYRRTPIADTLCNEVQDFLGASGRDYCIKSLGNALLREYALLEPDNEGNDDPTLDIDLADNEYSEVGYYSELRLILPLGYYDREKILRNVLIEDDVSAEAHPCKYRLWIGMSFNLVDPNNDGNTCSPMWRDIGAHSIECVDGATISQMQSRNQKPSIGQEWRCFEQNRYLYLKLRIESATGTPAIGGDVYLSKIDLDVLAQPK